MAPPTLDTAMLATQDGHFVDAQGRVALLRGVNLGGSSKLPFGYRHSDGASSSAADFFDGARGVSFVGRPFPLEEADLHFSRLQRWGLTLLRFVVTWEAIEHAGPGQYDREYLRYIRAVATKAAGYGLRVYVDPHQDVWSRWTGGDGAPMWTLECVGLEPRHFEATKAALCLETCGLPASQFPKMIWPTNYFKFACATMFTLFWGGSLAAPQCHVNGQPVQDFLQSHYLDAMCELATALRGLPNILGFGPMNEPSAGFLGLADLAQHFHAGELKYGLAPTPFQGMCLADGLPQTIERWSNGLNQHVLGRPDAQVPVDPQGLRAWKQGHRCVWRDEGVWDVDHVTGEPVLLRPAHFAAISFGTDCYLPFAERFTERLRAVLPDALLFVELPPLEFSVDEFPDIAPTRLPRAVNATHWYDGVTLFLRAWRPYFSVDPRSKRPAFGSRAVSRMHGRQLEEIKGYGQRQMQGAPTLIGETGIPFDMHGGRAFRSGDYSAQVSAMDHTLACLEASLVSFTLWCYTSDNCNAFGDQWNLEDLSLVSRDKPRRLQPPPSTSDRDACARAVRAFVRPYATKIAGVPSKSVFLLSHARYELEFTSREAETEAQTEAATEAETEIFVPHLQFPRGYAVLVSDGDYSVRSHDGWDVVSFRHSCGPPGSTHTHSVVLTSQDPSVDKRRRAQVLRQRLLLPPAVALAVFLLYLIFG